MQARPRMRPAQPHVPHISFVEERRLPDLLIAARAEQADLKVLHYDADFERIAELTGQPTQWIVPRSSVS